ncbi:MAG: orotate phosphoribosyltransferase [Gemmatimonadetes bacterium]|nr:orotate phosphoribosyltransferase [Gemmatimonadota bacterium]
MSYNELESDLIGLLKDRSLKHGDFLLSSGRRSSYYIDARKTTMSAAGLQVIGQLGLLRIRSLGWQAQAVGGLTLGADPVAYAIALASRNSPPLLDAFTVRKEAKTHGTAQLIEGCFEKGARVVVVEDVVTTGGSALRAIEAVRSAGGTAVGVLGVVDREEGGLAAIRSAGIPAEALVSIRELGLEP